MPKRIPMIFAGALCTILVGAGAVQAQFPNPLAALNAGTVSALFDGKSFSTNPSIAMMDDDKLVITSLSNVVQIQVENAAVGDFQIQPGPDGGAGDTLVTFQPQDGVYVVAIAGTFSIQTLTSNGASGSFELTGRNEDTEETIQITGGSFDVKFIGG